MNTESSLLEIEHELGDLPIISPSEESLLPGGVEFLADVVPPYKDMAGQLRKITDGYQLAQVFYTALELDLFSYLVDPITIPALCRRSQTDPTLTHLVAGVLVSCGILTRDQDLYSMHPEMIPFLLPDSPYYAHYLSYASVQRDSWQDLPERLIRKKHIHRCLINSRDTPESVRYTGRSALLGRLQATMQFIRSMPEISKVRTILDLGGGHGLFSISCAQEFPDAHITMIDHPDISQIAHAQIRYAGVEDRIRIVETDFRTHLLGGPYDLILDLGAFGGDIDQTKTWFRKIGSSLTLGGLYVRSSFTIDDCITGPQMTLLFEIEEIVSGRNNCHLTNTEVRTLLSDADMDLIHIEDLTHATGVPVRVIGARRKNYRETHDLHIS